MLLTNYILSAWRNIIRHKLFSAINILGLAIGLAAVMLITLFVRHEINYDNFWANSQNIYRMHMTFLPSGRPPMVFSMVAGPIIHVIKKDFPQIQHAARVARKRATIIKGDQYFEEQISLVDPAFVKIFDFKTITGNLGKALDDQSSLILNKTLADKYFPQGNAIGQTLTINADAFEREFTVAAIMENMPENSQVNVAAMVSIVEEEWSELEWMFASWFSVNTHLYYSVNPGTNIKDVNAQMPSFIDRNFPLQDSGDAVSGFVELNSQNIEELHLKAPGNSEHREKGSITTVLIFSAVAALILIIASINFMNLSTARASQRAKEVSLRKVMGASRQKLVAQFIGESVFLTLFALLVSMAFVELALPSYNQIIGKQLSIDYGSSDLLMIVGLSATVGILGGIYPAFILSSFRPADVLKANKSAETSASVKLRAALVIFQFAASISLFVSTTVVYGQMLYAKNIKLGFEQNNLLVINNLYRDAADIKLALLVNEFRQMPNISSVTWSNDAPGIHTENNTSMRTPEMPSSESSLIGVRGVGYEYFKTYNIDLLSGRFYGISQNDTRAETIEIREGRGHASSLIINETGLRRLGLGTPEEALGKILYRSVGNEGENLEREHLIIGVVPDIHLNSLKKEIRPEIFELQPDHAQYISIRYSGDPLETVNLARELWEREVPSIPFTYDHAVDSVDKQYKAEQGEMTMFAAFSSLAIFIACLGLYGLASFTAERRTKEIGIRKVMGASVFDVVKLLVWQFSKPVLIANLIAWPVSYYTMTMWLESFAYRIESFFILGFCLAAGVAALLIAWATVASNSIRVANTNPINALRYE